MSNVCRRGDNALDKRKTVVLFVPGVMGTRLEFPKAKEYWDPDDKWRMTHWLFTGVAKCADEMHARQPAKVIVDEKGIKLSERGRGWSSVVASFYLGYLRHLASQCYPGRLASVYAVGYDWRQGIWSQSGNATNSCAHHLLGEIDRILATEYTKEDDHELVIVTHSMGGLVTRAALKASPGLQSKVAGVIHVVQPVHGAPVAHRRFFTGTMKEHTDPDELAKILGNTAAKFAAMMHGLPGPMQLLPNNLYRDRVRPWLKFFEGGRWQSFHGDVYDLYKKPDGPPGLILHHEYDGKHDKLKKPKYKTELMKRLDEAKIFHSWLNDGTPPVGGRGGEVIFVGLNAPFKHGNTYALFATGLETDMACAFNPYKKPPGSERDSDEAWNVHKHWESWRGLHRQRLKHGDGTVPESSGDGLFPLQHGAPAEVPISVLAASPRQIRVPGVEHGGAFRDGTVRRIVDQLINRVVFEHGMREIARRTMGD